MDLVGVRVMISKSYKELCSLRLFEDRFEYLRLNGVIGKETFGHLRFINQKFYHSDDWIRFRDKVIIRDSSCNLGVEGYEILGRVIIHHINPITYDDIYNMRSCVFDMDNVICTDLLTHNAIHYGDNGLLVKIPDERYKFDTCPWRE